jgi:D-aminopeptidase
MKPKSLTLWLLVLGIAGTVSLVPAIAQTKSKPRARDLGIPFEGVPGPLNAITDVKGVEVGQVTLISGEGKLVVGGGPVRTGVTAETMTGINGNTVYAIPHNRLREILKKYSRLGKSQ